MDSRIADDPVSLEMEHKRTSIEQMRAEVEALRQRRQQWEAEFKREVIRLILYALLVGAALMAAGAALWELAR